MPNSADFVAHVLELAAPAGRASARAMFGGHGLYVDGVIVGIIVDDVLFLKADGESRAAFETLELPPFRYRSRDGVVHLTSYLRAPDEALESPPAMHEWLRRALGAAMRSRGAKARTSDAARPPPRRTRAGGARTR